MTLYIVCREDLCQMSSEILRVFLFKGQAVKFQKKYSPVPQVPRFPYHINNRYTWTMKTIKISWRVRLP